MVTAVFGTLCHVTIFARTEETLLLLLYVDANDQPFHAKALDISRYISIDLDREIIERLLEPYDKFFDHEQSRC